ncbi:MAG TPA: hypothetical protein VN577_02720 [Terriglobales bacterium]|nr:hypothetical protein [Terriglobales bacterium]
MKLLFSTTLLIGLLAPFSYAQQQAKPPTLLVHAAQCLLTKDFAALPKAKALDFGFVLDTKSYPGQKMLYVVNYTGPDRSNGMIFTLFLERRQRRQVFNIQNNGTFVRSKKGVDFTNSPLGGIWTQEHLVSAIKQIEQGSRYTIPVKDLRAPAVEIECASYADRS